MTSCGADDVESLAEIADGLAATSHGQCLADPGGDRQVLTAGRTLDLPIFRIPEDDLQSLSHLMSENDSCL